MKTWTRLDLLAVGTALLISLVMLGDRLYTHLKLEQSAGSVAINLFAIADAVNEYHEHTGRWFPEELDDRPLNIFPDPFHENSPSYQGLNEAWMLRENNAGLLLQLVRFDPDIETQIHLFDAPLREHEVYLRILLDYDDEGKIESESMILLRNQLPQNTMVQIDDHYFAIDMKRLFNRE